jgi:hypothetical protein
MTDAQEMLRYDPCNRDSSSRRAKALRKRAASFFFSPSKTRCHRDGEDVGEEALSEALASGTATLEQVGWIGGGGARVVLTLSIPVARQ